VASRPARSKLRDNDGFSHFSERQKSYGRRSSAARFRDRGWRVRRADGPSGCGVHLLRMLAGLENITGGEIMIDSRGQRTRIEGPRHRDGVPELRALSAHDGRREHGPACACVSDKMTGGVADAAKILNLDKLLALPARAVGWAAAARRDGPRHRTRPRVSFDEPLSNPMQAALRCADQALHQRLKTTTVYVTRPDRGDDHGRPHRRHADGAVGR
jgi:hypothetical protein